MDNFWRKITAENIGFFALVIYSFFAVSNHNVAEFFFRLSCAVGLVTLFKKRDNSLKIASLFLIITLAIQTIGWYFAKADNVIAVPELPKFDFMVKFYFFILLVPLLRGDTYKIVSVMTSALLGLLYILFIKDGASNYWAYAINGARPSFGLRNVQDLALFFSMVLISVLCLYRESIKRSGNKISFKVLGISLIALALFGVIFTKTRGVWLSLLLFSIYLIISNRKKILSRTFIHYSITTLMFAVLIIISGAGKTIIERFTQERETLVNIATLKWDRVPLTSAGIRFHLWSSGLKHVEERPIFGWHGPKTLKEKIKEERDIMAIHEYDHYHNIYIQTLMTAGVTGLIVFLLFIFYTYKIVRTARQQLLLTIGEYNLCVGFLIVIMVSSFFEPYILFSNGRFIFMLGLACIYSVCSSQMAQDKIEGEVLCQSR